MKKDESNKDRMMDALLQENARDGDDEEFLSQLEKSIDAAGEGGEVEKGERGGSRRWAWGLAAAACVGGVVGYEIFFGEEDRTRADRTLSAESLANVRGKEVPRERWDSLKPYQAAPQGKGAPMDLVAPSGNPGNKSAPGKKSPLIVQLDPSHVDPNTAVEDRRAKKPLAEHLDKGAAVGDAQPVPPTSPTSRPQAPPVIAGIAERSAVTKNSIDGKLRTNLGDGLGSGGNGGGGETYFGNRSRGRVGDGIQPGMMGNDTSSNFVYMGPRDRAVILEDADLTRAKEKLAKMEEVAGLIGGKSNTGQGAGNDAEVALRKEIDVLRKRIGEAERRPPAPVDRERYGQLVDQPWHTPWQTPLSTFSVDVDTASYTNIRRLLRSGAAIPKDAVRIEECVNYFDYAYPKPQEGPFAVHVDMASCPWKAEHHLVKIGLKGREVDSNTRPPSNLVFLIDVSGSMNRPNKLPLLVESMKVLVEELDERDTVGIVVYAGSAGTILEPTKVVGNGRTEILSALEHLRAGGSTAGAAGLRGAYQLAAKHHRKGGVNRVILATDGDFNVGTSSNGELVDLVKEKAKSGVSLSVLGFGTGNINDSMLEAITNDGNGNYFYIDSLREGRKVFLQNLSGTLVTIAKDVKIQVEFNPGKVAAYRLIGYANRILPPEAFNDDRVDAGDIGAGHTVTALYEIVPAGVKPPTIGGVDDLRYQKPANRAAVESPEWMTVKLRYKAPDGDESSLLELPVKNVPEDWTTASCDFQMAAGVALFGEKLRQSDKIDDAAWELVQDLARRGSKDDRHGHRAEFLELVNLAGRLPQPLRPVPEAPDDPVPAVEAPVAR